MRILSFVIVLLLTQSCCLLEKCDDPVADNNLPEFLEDPIVSPVYAQHLTEVSGMVPSFRYPGHVWLMEDSGNTPQVDLMKNDGTHIRSVHINAHNRDWEGLAAGPGPVDGVKYIYIGEIGDNNAVYGDYYIYRFPEPTEDQTVVPSYDTIHFKYPNNENYNAETLILDPKTKDLYVITKDQVNVRVYKLAYPQSTSSVNNAEFLGTIKYWGLTAGDISVNGDEILLKSYIAIYYWKIKAGDSIYKTLTRIHDVSAPYIVEAQGEAICWDLDANGYFTMSEKADRPTPSPLYYYQKVKK